MDEETLKEAHFRMSVDYFEDSKVAGLTPQAEVLFTRMMARSAKLHTDGVLTVSQLRSVNVMRLPALCNQLVMKGLVERCEVNGEEAFRLVRFLKWNRSKAQVEAAKERRRAAGRKGGIVSGYKRQNEASALASASKKSKQNEADIDIDVVTNVTTRKVEANASNEDPLLARLLAVLPDKPKAKQEAEQELAKWRAQVADWIIEDSVIEAENRGTMIGTARYIGAIVRGKFESSGNRWEENAS